ncbi:hypothetical protein TCAL_06166 [Tigriopus californicus]|uniref:FDX-ACB domain-containing protein n=1 Tax=Tigriopus californicus TaxID=6832 RepID=A0A553PJP5_TIGCA|nr:uncharacterized protein LOC131890089 [Tigriopus californicus]TRY77893.1 hypothetical protein TCAL_06166 [Tigriopus californicus]|eukprot:TCALIF_06166-PA protein Name:"Similar to Fdxacb1 Ferredoxin-fold anticodon-binding domain-containing protein 1 homolog (Mus musculus)" AED:0.03 eAED:0.07 QI:0/-1/0/1/-1/1/1/0/418
MDPQLWLKDRVLFLGEGNFSFSLDLLTNLLTNASSPSNNVDSITCTAFEPDFVSEEAKNNAQSLIAMGVNVRLGIDGTRLSEAFPEQLFDRIVFMFPHVGGKMRIERNRQLLQDLGLSFSYVTHSESQVFLALTDGQGGTLIDEKPRTEGNSWQVIKMMSHAGFQLVKCFKCDIDQWCPNYRAFGYRSLNKGFATIRPTMHVFQTNGMNGLISLSTHNPNLTIELMQLILQDERAKIRLAFESTLPIVHSDIIVKVEETAGSRVETDIKDRYVLLGQCLFSETHSFGENPVVFSLRSPSGITRPLSWEGSTSDWRELWTVIPSLWPPIYQHDLSFWLLDPKVTLADVRLVLWRVGGLFIVEMECVDTSYRCKEEGTSSMTLRITYQSFSVVLSPKEVWELHLNVIGASLTKECGVKLR